MATELINRYSDRIGDISLHAGTGGAFEVSVDGQQIYSKLATKRYPELQEIVDGVQARLPPVPSS
jgi:selT/selW/selH-like putative selenoprotein